MKISTAVLSSLMAASAWAAPAVSFNAPRVAGVHIAQGSYVSSAGTGDFNGDGKLDLAAGSFSETNNTGLISILLGNGHSGFTQTSASYALPGLPVGFVVADLNLDGRADLVVGVRLYGVSVLLGNGDGTFQPAITYNTGGEAEDSVRVADFNSDGKPDIAIVDYLENVSILLGNGDGTFQPPATYRTPSPQFLAVGDLNGDGTPDLAVVNLEEDTISILLGRRDGTFHLTINIPVQPGPSCVAVADFDGDGKADLVVGYGISKKTQNVISILPGNGDGTFRTPVNLRVGKHPDFITVADLNRDGKPDLVVFNGGPDANEELIVSILLSNGDGTFQPQLNYAGSYGAFVGDFNSDGAPDLAFPVDTGVATLMGSGQGTFQHASSFPAGNAPTSVVAADFNGDGTPDLAVVNSSGVSILLTGTHQQFNFPAGTNPNWVAAADFNGDGKIDLAIANEIIGSTGTVSILLGNGDGTFQPPAPNTAWEGAIFVAIGDFNRDGKADLAVTDSSSAAVSILLGNGDGTFQPRVNYPAGGTFPNSVAIADFNGDGNPDLAVTIQGVPVPSVSILFGNGDGTFQPAVTIRTGANKPTFAIAGDLNGDGKPDLAVAGNGSAGGNLLILLGNGDGTFHATASYAVGSEASSIAIGDFDGDGEPDLMVASSASVVSAFLGNGDGRFRAAGGFFVASGPFSITGADFNGDGQPDLATANLNSNDVTVLTNTSLAVDEN